MTRRRRERETQDIADFLRRMLKAYGRRVADSDDYDLAEMADVMVEMENAMQAAVDGQRERGASWATIGSAFGITRQAAQQRFGRASNRLTAV